MLIKILDIIEAMSNKENYSTNYLCNKDECDVIENVEKNGRVSYGLERVISDFSSGNTTFSFGQFYIG
jgi:hypothetical protein